MVHLSGNLALIRARFARAFALRAMRWRTPVTARSLVTCAALAGALALAGCYGDEGYQLPTQAMKELSPEMLTLLQQKNMPKDSPILVRLFKEESELEVWKEDTTGAYQLLKVYPICRWSGELGPKKVEGDRQAPEGFYSITPGLMNPNSSYFLAINIGFPNAYDKANGYSGGFLMIHGDCSSRGCYAMTDEQIGEIYSLAREAFLGGQKEFQIQAYPFRLTPANLARHRTNPNMAFWTMLKEGNDHFEVTHQEPKVDVCDRHYVFDAQPPANSTKPLAFSPTGHCPAYEVPQEIAGPALQKQRNDDYQVAQLTKENVPTAPVVMGTDGGMNRVFAPRLAETNPVLDNDGRLHAPPIHPGMSAPTLSGPREDPEAGIVKTASSAQKPAMFGSLFDAKTTSQSNQVAATDSGSSEGFFAKLFKPKDTTTQQPAAPGVILAGLRPAPEPRKTEAPKIEAAKSEVAKIEHPEAQKPETAAAAAAKTPAKPSQEANAYAPPATGSLMKGAQAVVPSGSFDGRWAGLQ
ncbi:MAG: murein L,D-transpeptidase family protein [Xanthobacteraceae bacterium]